MNGFYSKKLEEIYKTEGEIEVFIESTFDEISEKYTEHIIHFGDEKIVYSVEEERNNDLKLLKSLNWSEDLDLSFF